jgi:hypothetical protein
MDNQLHFVFIIEYDLFYEDEDLEIDSKELW